MSDMFVSWMKFCAALANVYNIAFIDRWPRGVQTVSKGWCSAAHRKVATTSIRYSREFIRSSWFLPRYTSRFTHHAAFMQEHHLLACFISRQYPSCFFDVLLAFVLPFETRVHFEMHSPPINYNCLLSRSDYQSSAVALQSTCYSMEIFTVSCVFLARSLAGSD